jgi:hypothetical protein
MSDRNESTPRTDDSTRTNTAPSSKETAEPSAAARAQESPQDDEDSAQTSESRPRGTTEDPDRTL